MARKLGYLGSHGSIQKSAKNLEKNKGQDEDLGLILFFSFIIAIIIVIYGSIA